MQSRRTSLPDHLSWLACPQSLLATCSAACVQNGAINLLDRYQVSLGLKQCDPEGQASLEACEAQHPMQEALTKAEQWVEVRLLTDLRCVYRA